MKPVFFILIPILSFAALAQGFEEEVRPFLEKHCLRCHGGEKTKGEVDLSDIKTMSDAESRSELWEAISFVIEDREMPPEDEDQPSKEEFDVFSNWYEHEFLGAAEAKPAPFKPRRLSGPEYRKTMRSVFGFDLEVNIIEAEQTVVEKSLVMKLLPTDPPGASGFVNDTHGARLSTTIWSQYSYLADSALEELFSPPRLTELTALVGSPIVNGLTDPQCRSLIENFTTRAFRRPASEDRVTNAFERVKGKIGTDLTDALKAELKRVLMSPAFLYRGFLITPDSDEEQQRVDDFELAERLSYFLWEDMPDEELFEAAASGELHQPEIFAAQLDRMLVSPKSRTLAESFGSQWLLLDQVQHDKNDPAFLDALVNQPLDFLNYLFTEDRPVIELIDSKVTFANGFTASFYGEDRKQLTRYHKPAGTEVAAQPNQKINLVASAGARGGIITMPGVLGMNRGPILRGTWMLRQIMGEHLGEPPADVPPIKSSPKGENLSFRERFEQHRSDKSCALCHDRIDPLGFALEGYDTKGALIAKGTGASAEKIDESGQLPSGESFQTFEELKSILISSERETITRNAVEQMMRYALCRKLERNDGPVVEQLTSMIMENNGTWRDLIHGIANSVIFRETLIPPSH